MGDETKEFDLDAPPGYRRAHRISERGPTSAFMPGFATEAAALDAFDLIIKRHSHAFAVYREIKGSLLQPRPNTGGFGPLIIDRIVVPKQPVIDAGWVFGPFGVEANGLGKPVAQAQDYSRAAFQMPASFRHATIMLQWGDIGSIAAQSRIGLAHPYKDGIEFGFYGTHLIRVCSGGISARSFATGHSEVGIDKYREASTQFRGTTSYYRPGF